MTPLTELNPKWCGLLRPDSGEGITLDCPKCGSSHRLCAYFDNPLDGEPAAYWQKPIWKRDGETFETLTISPSIEYPCFHGWIEDGQVIDISESPMRVKMLIGGAIRDVALSPKQAKALRDSSI
jgi:hypothetical protein